MAEREYWFKNKRYGWGWYPATWQGWLALLLYVCIVVAGSLWLMPEGKETADRTLLFLGWTGIWTALLIFVSYKRGEKPGWHWGGKE